MTRALGLALVEFLWQGVAISATTAIALVALRRATANARYLTGVIGLGVMMVMPVATFIGHARNDASAPHASSLHSQAAASQANAADAPAAAESPGPQSDAFSWAWLDPRLQYVAVAWAACVMLLAAQFLRGWWRVALIRRRGVAIGTGKWTETVRDLGDRLGVRRQLSLLESALIEVPAVIGILRPVIVVPASALSGLAPAHLEAILAHELAHIRRADYLVNVLQCIVETLLFYHPAVWWVSKQIRIEREHCCDDLAASVCGNRMSYARALASLEELRTGTPRLAMAASGGELLARIRRLVEPASASGLKLSGGMAMTAVLATLLFTIGTELNGAAMQSPPPTPPPVTNEIQTAPPAPPPPAQPARQTVTPPPPPQAPVPRVVVRRETDGTPVIYVTVRPTDQPPLPPRPPTPPPPSPQGRSAPESFDLAKQAFERGDFRLAERLANEALQLVRAAGRGMAPPPPPAPPALVRTTGDRRTVRRGDNVQISVNNPTPIYPPAALAAGVEGTVVIETTIGTNGTVKSTRVISGPQLLQEAAVTAVRQWPFTPRLENGVPAEYVVTISIRFVR